jgi:hypothetical protein
LFSMLLFAPVSQGSDAVMLIVLMVYLAFVVVNVAAMWRLFTKSGVPGWSVLIPIYGSVKLLQISGRSGWWTLAFLVPFLNLFATIRLAFDLARAFGRGIHFGCGLLLLPMIFVPILGFGDSRYALASANR